MLTPQADELFCASPDEPLLLEQTTTSGDEGASNGAAANKCRRECGLASISPLLCGIHRAFYIHLLIWLVLAHSEGAVYIHLRNKRDQDIS